jgi:hypothetical protein
VPARSLRRAGDDAPGLAQLKFWIASKSFVAFAAAFAKFAAVQRSWRDFRIAQ